MEAHAQGPSEPTLRGEAPAHSPSWEHRPGCPWKAGEATYIPESSEGRGSRPLWPPPGGTGPTRLESDSSEHAANKRPLPPWKLRKRLRPTFPRRRGYIPTTAAQGPFALLGDVQAGLRRDGPNAPNVKPFGGCGVVRAPRTPRKQAGEPADAQTHLEGALPASAGALRGADARGRGAAASREPRIL